MGLLWLIHGIGICFCYPSVVCDPNFALYQVYPSHSLTGASKATLTFSRNFAAVEFEWHTVISENANSISIGNTSAEEHTLRRFFINC